VKRNYKRKVEDGEELLAEVEEEGGKRNV